LSNLDFNRSGGSIISMSLEVEYVFVCAVIQSTAAEMSLKWLNGRLQPLLWFIYFDSRFVVHFLYSDTGCCTACCTTIMHDESKQRLGLLNRPTHVMWRTTGMAW